MCPACRGELADAPGAFTCAACAVAYPVVDGVPWLVPEHARRFQPRSDGSDPEGAR